MMTRSRSGFALLVALWLLVAIAAVGLQFTLAATDRRATAINVAEWTEARAAADAGLATARSTLERLSRGEQLTGRDRVTPLASDPWGVVSSLSWDTTAAGDERFTIRYADLGAKLNVNRAEPDEMRALLIALHIDAPRAERIADAIADWRDEDDLRHARGAERDDYLRAGADALPANQPFANVRELSAVLGMTPEIMTRLRPYVTTTGSGQINLNAAPREVLATVPGMSDELIALVLRERGRTTQPRNQLELANRLSPGALAALQREMPRFMLRASYATTEIDVHIEGWRDGSPVRGTLDALLVRGGTTAFVVRRRAR